MKFINYYKDYITATQSFNRIKNNNNLDFFNQYKNYNFFYNFNTKPKKQFKKTFNRKKLNLKKSSYRRDKNVYMLKLFLNLSTKKGCKETFLKNFNTMVYFFLENFNEKSDYFSQLPQYYYYYYSLEYNFLFYDFESIFDDCLRTLKVVFNIKYKKLDKKQRKKSKQKFKVIIRHIPEKNRLKHILNLINRSSEEVLYKNLHKRILKSLAEIFFDYNNSFLQKRKNYIYSIVFEDLKKKHE